MLEECAADGKYWKTYLFVNSERKEQYIILYRIGIFNGVCTEFMITFPHVRKEPAKPNYVLTLNEDMVIGKMAGIYCYPGAVKNMMDYFNVFCENYKMFNNNQFLADVQLITPPNDAKAFRDTTLRK